MSVEVDTPTKQVVDGWQDEDGSVSPFQGGSGRDQIRKATFRLAPQFIRDNPNG